MYAMYTTVVRVFEGSYFKRSEKSKLAMNQKWINCRCVLDPCGASKCTWIKRE